MTASDNQRHAYRHNLKTKPEGLLNGRQELEEYEVLEIYSKLLQGCSNKSLSDLYNVSTAQILRIKKKEQWVHLTKNLPEMTVKSKRRDLTEEEVIKICECIVKGLTAKETIDILDFSMSKWQFYDVKRKKNNKEISDKYF